jgi:hypothetical protein
MSAEETHAPSDVLVTEKSGCGRSNAEDDPPHVASVPKMSQVTDPPAPRAKVKVAVKGQNHATPWSSHVEKVRSAPVTVKPPDVGLGVRVETRPSPVSV